MLKTRCITRVPDADDGIRISIMNRHTLSDGITPNPDINLENFDCWWPALAPQSRLLGDYYKRGLPWHEFAAQFSTYLSEPDMQSKLCWLVEVARVFEVTLLCIEETPEHCHRRLVAEACEKIDQTLTVVIE